MSTGYAVGDMTCADRGNHLIVELSENPKGDMYVASGTFKCVRCGMEFVEPESEDVTHERVIAGLVETKEVERESRD